ncbi:MAG: C10 family peptidase [Kiritimatiellia bacterium]
MRKSFLTIIWALLAAGLFASSVTPEMAQSAADAWVRKNAPFGAKGTAASVRTVCDTNAAQTVLWYEVSMSGGGVLVVAPATEIEPVVAALGESPADLPPGHVLPDVLKADLRARLRLLGLYAEDSSSGISLSGVAKPAAVPSEIAQWGARQQAKWAKLGVGVSLQEAVTEGVADVAVQIGVVDGFEAGGRFTHWNQGAAGGGYCYNYYTPNHAVCGCVATAMAAVMQYYAVTGATPFARDCSYNGVTRQYDAKGGAYDWNILPVRCGGTNETDETSTALGEAQRELLGRVAYDSAVSVGMAWTDDLSSAFVTDVAESLRTDFGFADARAVDGLTGARYDRFIWNQCRAGAPVVLGISGGAGGHAVVATGFGLDADGVQRVRIFCGWGGAGDAWYALPHVTTRDAAGNVTYSYDIVSSAVTMIGYESDETVPVVGQVTLPGATVEMPGVPRTLQSDGNGYFATRVSPQLANTTLVCMGKENTGLVIGDAARTAGDPADADALYLALPEAIDWPLLNMPVAFSFDDAKQMALERNLAILRISGTSGESNTTAIVNRVFAMDETNEDDIVNRFVYFYSAFDSGDPTRSDGNPSFGVFLPREADAEGRWMYNNGRLSYGFALTAARDVEEDDAEGLLQVVGSETNTLVFTAVRGQTSTKEVFGNGASEEIEAAVLASFQTVLDRGWDLFLRETSAIRLTVASSTGKNNETPSPVPAYGVHDAAFTNGEVVVATNDAEITNDANTVVFGCSGWTLTNETTGAFLAGTGRVAEFTLVSNDVCTLTWQMDRTNAVYLAVRASDEAYGTVSPASGWYPYGEPVVFTVAPAADWRLSNWIGDGDNAALTGAEAMGTALVVPATAPGAYLAQLARGAAATVAATNRLRSTALVWDAAAEDYTKTTNAPAAVVYGLPGFDGLEIASGKYVDLPATDFCVCLEAKSFVDEDGRTLEFVGVVTSSTLALSTTTVAAVDLTEGDADLVWLWCPQETEIGDFTIDWNDGLDNLTESFTTNLLTAAQFAASGLTLDDLAARVTVPTGWKVCLEQDVDGNVVAGLELDEDVLRPVAADGEPLLTIAANADGTVTVRANVGNGVRGFVYTLYSTDDLTGGWQAVATGEYDTGAPSRQATADGPLTLEIGLTPDVSKRFYKLVVSAKGS